MSTVFEGKASSEAPCSPITQVRLSASRCWVLALRTLDVSALATASNHAMRKFYRPAPLGLHHLTNRRRTRVAHTGRPHLDTGFWSFVKVYSCTLKLSSVELDRVVAVTQRIATISTATLPQVHVLAPTLPFDSNRDFSCAASLAATGPKSKSAQIHNYVIMMTIATT